MRTLNHPAYARSGAGPKLAGFSSAPNTGAPTGKEVTSTRDEHRRALPLSHVVSLGMVTQVPLPPGLRISIGCVAMVEA